MVGGKSRLAAGAILIVVAALLGAVLAAPGTAGAPGAQIAGGAKVKLGDNFYAPTRKTVKKGKRVKFRWIGSNSHNVTLKKGPGKKFKSKTTSKTGVNYKRKFKRRGTYKIFCTIHPTTMNLRLKVK